MARERPAPTIYGTAHQQVVLAKQIEDTEGPLAVPVVESILQGLIKSVLTPEHVGLSHLKGHVRLCVSPMRDRILVSLWWSSVCPVHPAYFVPTHRRVLAAGASSGCCCAALGVFVQRHGVQRGGYGISCLHGVVFDIASGGTECQRHRRTRCNFAVPTRMVSVRRLSRLLRSHGGIRRLSPQ